MGDDGAEARGSLAYAEAKADYDGVLAGLIVALARGDAPKSLTDLEGQLSQGYAAREAFLRERAEGSTGSEWCEGTGRGYSKGRD